MKDVDVIGWQKTIKGNRIIFTKTDSIPLFCCELNALNFPVKVKEVPYFLVVEKAQKLKRREIKKREKLQEQILQDLKSSSDISPTAHGNLEHFKIRKNTIDSLRVPLFSKGKYSYFIYDSFEQAGYTNLYVESAKYKHDVKEFRELIEKTLTVK